MFRVKLAGEIENQLGFAWSREEKQSKSLVREEHKNCCSTYSKVLTTKKPNTV